MTPTVLRAGRLVLSSYVAACCTRCLPSSLSGRASRARQAPMARRARLGGKEPAAAPASPARQDPWVIGGQAEQRRNVARAASVAAWWWAQWALMAREGQWGLEGLQVCRGPLATKEPKGIRACQGRGETRASLAPLDCLELPGQQARPARRAETGSRAWWAVWAPPAARACRDRRACRAAMASWGLLETQVVPGIVAHRALLAPLARAAIGDWRARRGLLGRPVRLGLLASQGLREVSFIGGWGGGEEEVLGAV